MSDADATNSGRDLAQRAVDSFLTLVRRGTQLALGTLLIVSVISVGSFALGVAALSDGIQTVWIIIGGFGAFVAIGSVLRAMFGLWSVRRMSTQLVADVQALITNDPGSERVVIETVRSSNGAHDQSAVVMSRQFFAMNQTLGTRSRQFTALAAALRSITTFPLLMLLATVFTVGMAGLGLLFAIGIAL